MENEPQTTTEQDREQKHAPNPEGKGGFGDHPENRNPGGRPKNQESFAYWFNVFKNMTVDEFKDYERTKPDGQRTVAESIAYVRVLKSRKNLAEFREVANRTEGMPVQTVKQKFDDKVTSIKVEIYDKEPHGTDDQGD